MSIEDELYDAIQCALNDVESDVKPSFILDAIRPVLEKNGALKTEKECPAAGCRDGYVYQRLYDNWVACRKCNGTGKVSI